MSDVKSQLQKYQVNLKTLGNDWEAKANNDSVSVEDYEKEINTKKNILIKLQILSNVRKELESHRINIITELGNDWEQRAKDENENFGDYEKSINIEKDTLINDYVKYQNLVDEYKRIMTEITGLDPKSSKIMYESKKGTLTELGIQ